MNKPKSLSKKKKAEIQEQIDNLKSYEQVKVVEICNELDRIIADKLIPEDDPLMFSILFTLTRHLGMRHQLEAAMFYTSYAEELAGRLNKHQYAIKARMNKAIIMVESGGIHDAIEVWSKLVDEVGGKDLLPSLYSNLGKAYNMLDQHEKAMEYMYRGIEVLQDTQRVDELGNIYNNLASECRILDNLEKALEYYTLALELSEKAGNQQRIAMINNNLCLLHIDLKNYEQAHKYGTLSMTYVQKFCPENEWTHIYGNMGLIHLYQNRLEEAQDFFVKSLTIAKKYADHNFEAVSLNNLSRIALESQDYARAIRLAEESLQASASLQVGNAASASYGLLRQAYLAKRQYKKAYLALEKIQEFEHQRTSENPKMIMARAETAYLGRKIEAQAEVYRLQNIELSKSNEIITDKTRELELTNHKLETTNCLLNRLVSIIAHDVRGPVSSISQVLGVFSSMQMTSAERDDLIGKMHKSAIGTLILLEDLLLLIRNYNPEYLPEPKEIDLVEIIEDTLNMCKTNALQKKLSLSFVHSHPVHSLTVNADHLKVILRNIIGNAIKFTPENGSVSISVKQSDHKHVITIADSGIGMEQQQVDKIIAGSVKSTIGTANEKGFGMGLRFALEFLKHTNGILEISSAPWKGSTFTITYKCN